MYSCPYCLKDLEGPCRKENKLYYFCVVCDKYFDMEYITHLLLLSTAFVRKISDSVLSEREAK